MQAHSRPARQEKPPNREYHRTANEVALKGSLYPMGGLLSAGKRYAAILEVPCSLPDEAYANLLGKADSFRWFLPYTVATGEVVRFSVTHPEPEGITGRGPLETGAYAKVVYLSPQLESTAFDVVVSIVAHELAHIALDHMVVQGQQRIAEREMEANELVVLWGFGRENRKRLGAHKRLETIAEKRKARLAESLVSEQEQPD